MKTLYALIFVLLSSPTIADVLDITPTGADDTTSAISAPAPKAIEYAVDFDVDYVNDYEAEPVPASPAKPTDVAETQLAAIPDDMIIADELHTAGVISPATSNADDNPINPEAESSQDVETGFDWE